VLRDGALIGLVTEADILRERAKLGDRADKSFVREMMTHTPPVAYPDEPLSDVGFRMMSQRIDGMPVVDGEYHVVGLITTADLIFALISKPLPLADEEARVVREVMVKPAVTVKQNDPLLDAVSLMLGRGIRHLPVVDESGRCLGVLSDRDVRSFVGDPGQAVRQGASRRELRSLAVSGAMTLDPVLVREDEPLSAVVHRFLDARVGAVPVIDRQERVVGVISYIDLLRTLA
jgi:CBS domain-containing protein